MEKIWQAFMLKGKVVSCTRYGSGHINETYLLRTDAPHDYILQKINRRIFKNVEQLMENAAAVTKHLIQKDANPRHTQRLIAASDGKDWYVDAAGEYWRVYDFIADSVSLDRPETAEDFYQSAVAFGHFQMQLADFPAETLHETIPHFHDTPARYENFKRAVQEDVCGRLESVKAEVDFILARENDARVMMDLLKEGKLPLRVTHNDTKLNNVLLDKNTRKPLCVIDLDTVMPGLAANDFGDSIRFGASTADEDEQNLDKVEMSLELFETYARGFLGACGGRLTDLEIKTLPWGAKLMTLECGVRFLTDYLQGDVYFATHYPMQNLYRCRTQLKLVWDMEQKWEQMQQIICDISEGK